MYQFLVSFTVTPEHRADFVRVARQAGPYSGAFFAEASTYAEGPTWLMRGTLVDDPATV